MTKIISVVSSTPRAGKTAVCMNLSVQLAAKGFRTCLLADTAELSRLNNVFGLHPKKDLKALSEGKASLDEIIQKNFFGVDVLPGSFNDERLIDADKEGLKKLADTSPDLDSYDYLIIDNAAGADWQTVGACLAATQTLLLINPTIEVITDAVDFVGHLKSLGYRHPLGVVINQCSNFQFGRLALGKLNESLKPLELQGVVPYGIVLQDAKIKEALDTHKPLCTENEEAVFCKGLAELVEKIAAFEPNERQNTSLEVFWHRLFNHLATASDQGSSPSSVSNAVPGLQNFWASNRPAGTSDAGLIQSSAHGMERLNQGLNNIAKNLNNVTRELRQIRIFLKRQNRGSATATPPKPPQETKIPLDFETFLSERKEEQ